MERLLDVVGTLGDMVVDGVMVSFSSSAGIADIFFVLIIKSVCS